MVDLNLPFSFVIPIPSPAARVFGRESTAGPLACFIVYRANTIERERIAIAADLCGVSSGTFMRSVVMNVVEEVLRHTTDPEAAALAIEPPEIPTAHYDGTPTPVRSQRTG
jgi:hypothetical protein